MTTEVTGQFAIKSWDEAPYDESEDGNLARAVIAQSYTGGIEGESSVTYLLSYPPESIVYFVGLERIVGRIGDRSGSFVVQHSGTFENGTASSNWFVVPGSGSGDLRGLRGEGSYEAGHDTLEYSFRYDIDPGTGQ